MQYQREGHSVGGDKWKKHLCEHWKSGYCLRNHKDRDIGHGIGDLILWKDWKGKGKIGFCWACLTIFLNLSNRCLSSEHPFARNGRSLEADDESLENFCRSRVLQIRCRTSEVLSFI